jgi:hypothetical protein
LKILFLWNKGEFNIVDEDSPLPSKVFANPSEVTHDEIFETREGIVHRALFLRNFESS